MEHINRIELKGRVGLVRTNVHNGTKVANFSLVTDYLYKTREGNAVSESTWFNVVAWGNKEFPDLDRLGKGMLVHVIGRMRSTKYNNEDGMEKQYYEVLANKLVICEDEEPIEL